MLKIPRGWITSVPPIRTENASALRPWRLCHSAL